MVLSFANSNDYILLFLLDGMANRPRIARFAAAQALKLIIDAEVTKWGHLWPWTYIFVHRFSFFAKKIKFHILSHQMMDKYIRE